MTSTLLEEDILKNPLSDLYGDRYDYDKGILKEDGKKSGNTQKGSVPESGTRAALTPETNHQRKKVKAGKGVAYKHSTPEGKAVLKEAEENNKVLEKELGSDLLQELRLQHKINKEKQAQATSSINQNILWAPHAGPQTEFLASIEYEVGMFGGRGSGKSDCLLVDPMRFVTNPNFKGLLIRRTMPALREIISRAKQLYPKMYPGTKWKDQEKLFEFPSGAIIEFGYFDHIDDYDRYHGRQFSWVGIDEITQYPEQEYYDKIKSVARSTDPSLQPRIRCTCNPSGPGRVWVRDHFQVSDRDSNEPFFFNVETKNGNVEVGRKYIMSTIYDNPTAVDNDPQYIAYLESLPEIQRRQWLMGDFEAAEGIAFDDFNKEIHVVAPFKIPNNWLKFRCIDWGFRSKAVCLWVAVDQDYNAYVYREYVTSGVHADIFARNVLDLEYEDNISYGIIDGSVGDQRGITGPTIDEEMRKVGLISTYADKAKGSRIHGKNLIHKYLRIDEDTKQPRIKFFSNCKQIIKELGSLMIDKNNSEDVNTRMEDHAYDALRYGLASRPEPSNAATLSATGVSGNKLRMIETPVVNSTYGY